MNFASRATLAALLVGVLAACSKNDSPPTPPAGSPAARHEETPPHGGTVVALGGVYHLELVLDATAGKLSAYVLDDEMEEFVRIKPPSFEAVATIDGRPETLVFHAVADSATGETVGATSLFGASAGWLKTTRAFDVVLTKLEIRGTTFTAVAFNFPRGNARD